MADKVGQELYTVTLEPNGKAQMELWILRTIRKGRCFAVRKDQFTWIKRSKKQGDYGWANYISEYDRYSWPIGSRPDHLRTTKRSAWLQLARQGESFVARGSNQAEIGNQFNWLDDKSKAATIARMARSQATRSTKRKK